MATRSSAPRVYPQASLPASKSIAAPGIFIAPLVPRTREQEEADFPALDKAPFEILLDEKLSPVLAELDRLEALTVDEDLIDLYKLAKDKGESGKDRLAKRKFELATRLEVFEKTLDGLNSVLAPIKYYLNDFLSKLPGRESPDLAPVRDQLFVELGDKLRNYQNDRSSFVKNRQASSMGDSEGETQPFDSIAREADLKNAFTQILNDLYAAVKNAALNEADAAYKAYETECAKRKAVEVDAARVAEAGRQTETARVAADAAREEKARLEREAAEVELKLRAEEALRNAISTFVAVKMTEHAEKRTGREGIAQPNGRISGAEENFFDAFINLLANRTGKELEASELAQDRSSPGILRLSIEQAVQFQQGFSACLPDDPKREVYEGLLALQSAEVVRLYRELLMRRVTDSFVGVSDAEVQRAAIQLAAQSVIRNETTNPLPAGAPLVELIFKALGNRPLAPVERPAASPAMITSVVNEGEIVSRVMDVLKPQLEKLGIAVASRVSTAAAAAVPTADAIADAQIRRQPKVKQPGFLSRLPGRLALLGTGAALGAGAVTLKDGIPSDWFSRDEAVDVSSDVPQVEGAKAEAKGGAQENGAEQAAQAPTFTAWVRLPDDVRTEDWDRSFGNTGDSKLAICCKGGEPVVGRGTICTSKTIYEVPPAVESAWNGNMWDTVGEDVTGYKPFPEGEERKSVCEKAQEGTFGTVLIPG